MEEKKFLEKSIDSGKGKICYYAIGDREKTAVLFLHGLSANHTTWERAALKACELGFYSILPDLRGHGHSDKTRSKKLYRLERFSNDLKLILDNEGIKNIILVGYSFGGSLAIDFSLKFSQMVKGLVLVSANHENPLNYWRSKVIIPLAKAFFFSLSYLFIWQKRKAYDYYRPIKEKGYFKSVWLGLKTMPISVNLWMLMMMAEVKFKNRLSKINAPVWIVHSDHDPFVTKAEVNDMLNSFPNAKDIVSKNKNHFLATAAMEETMEIIIRFLKEIIIKEKLS